MNLWIDDALVLKRPRLKWFDAETVLAVLAGFHIIHGMPLQVQPVYRNILIFERRKGYIRLEFAFTHKKGLRIFLRRKRPFIITEALTYEETIYVQRHRPPWER